MVVVEARDRLGGRVYTKRMQVLVRLIAIDCDNGSHVSVLCFGVIHELLQPAFIL